MKNIFRLYILVFSLSINLNPLLAQWVHTSDPVGGFVNTILVNGSTIYIGTHNGVGLARTTDNGASWTAANSGLDGQDAQALAVTPNGSGGNYLFAGSGTMYRSSDDGAHWVEANTGMGWHGIQAFAVRMRGTDSADIFAGGRSDVFLSTDYGNSWTQLGSGLPDAPMYFLSVHGTYLFAGMDSYQSLGVYRSTNSGATWSPANAGLPAGTTGYSFTSCPDGAGGTNFFLGTCADSIYVSRDSCTTWSRASMGLPPSDYIRSIVADTNFSGGWNLFAASGYNGIYRSSNNAATWTAVNTGVPTGAFVNALAVKGTDLFAGTMSYGILRSTDNGAGWTIVDGGRLVAPINCLLMDDTILYAGSCAGLHISTDYSTSWTTVTPGLPGACVQNLAVASAGSAKYLFAATSLGLFRSTDGGVQWTSSGNGLPTGSVTLLTVNADGSGGNTVFAVANGNGIREIYRSTNNGNTWALSGSGLPVNPDVRSLTACQGIIYTGISTSNNGYIYRSTDNGLTWTESDDGIYIRYQVNSFAMSANDTGTAFVFAATDDKSVYRSSDEGLDWTEADVGLPQGCSSLATAPTHGGGSELFAAGVFYAPGGWQGPYNVYLSTDNGNSWTAVSEGIPDYYPNIYTLAIGLLNNGTEGAYVFAGCNFNEITGVWRRPLSEFDIPRTYAIYTTAGAHGNIYPSGTVVVDSGASQQFTIIPDNDYQIDSVIVDGVKIAPTTSYTFANIVAVHSISATFKRSGIPTSPWTYTNTGMNHTIIVDTSVHPTVNGVSLDAGDFIGVFYDSSGTLACGGYEMWTGSGAISVAAFGNELTLPAKNGFATGEVFEWKIFRWQEDKVYDASATYSLPDSTNHLTNTNTYATNGISSLRSLVGGVQTESLAVRRGWSIVSSYVNPHSTVLDSLFSPIKSDLIILKNGNGKTYIPSVPVNSIGSWNSAEGYQLKMNASRTFAITGMRIAPEMTPITVPPGWSIVPYLRQSEMGVDSALSSVTHTIIIVKDQDGRAYIPSIPVNGIGKMEPGEGYQVKLSGLDTLVYPMNLFLLSKSIVEVRPTITNPSSSHYRDKLRTDNNATIVFPKKVISGVLKTGDEVGVFDEKGMLVGSGMYEGENFAVAAWGDDPTTPEKDGLKVGECYEVRFWHGSTEHHVKSIQWSQGSATYEVNGISVAGSVEVDIADMPVPDRVELFQNYPNPFNPSTTIRFSIPGGMNVRIRIYNILGEVIAEAANQYFETGYHEVSFNSAAYPSGIYYCRIEANGSSDVKKMVFMK